MAIPPNSAIAVILFVCSRSMRKHRNLEKTTQLRRNYNFRSWHSSVTTDVVDEMPYSWRPYRFSFSIDKLDSISLYLTRSLHWYEKLRLPMLIYQHSTLYWIFSTIIAKNTYYCFTAVAIQMNKQSYKFFVIWFVPEAICMGQEAT